MYWSLSSLSSFFFRTRGLHRLGQRIGGGVATSTTLPKTPRHDARIAWITAPNREVAELIGSGLVEGKLAACVSTIPGVQSTYRWRGKLEHDEEILLMVKTQASLIPKIIAFVEEKHPYDSPEVITTKIEEGRQEYLDWVRENTVGEEGEEKQ
mmetsp:Transcript_16669/g.31528  ORF Transcript_16669/g.31528 Transcript_16669/m.31528 type:complete len:153 (-) Transcript_16669:314-772(-)